MVNKSPSKYGKKTSAISRPSSLDHNTKDREVETYKGLPQHIKAAKLLLDNGKEIKAGDIISYVKTKTGEGVKPIDLLIRMEDIDTEKYLETMEATFDQLLSSLNFNFKSILGKPRQSNLDELFWSR